MKKLFLFAVLFVAAAFSSCKHDDVETPVVPDPVVVPESQPLAIAFAEGNSLQFNAGETKTVHYTITSSSDKIAMKAEMNTPDGAYKLSTVSTSATEGTITITAKTPSTENRVMVTVSDGSQIVTAEIAVSTNPIPEELAITFAEGNSLQFNAGETKTIHYTITGGSDNTVVKAEMQTSDGAYTVETTPTSATEGTITITAKTPSTENCVLVTVSDGSQIVTAEIAVSTNPIPEELAITFAEGNSLQFDIDETKTIHYTITGGSDNTVVKAEMQTSDGAYTVETTPTSATEGTITITAKTPSTENRVMVTVSDGSQTIMAAIDVTVILRASFDGQTAVVTTPGTLAKLLANYNNTITELTVIGNLNDEDIAVLKNLPNLAILDMEHANLEELPAEAFKNNKSLTSVKLPRSLKTIGDSAFRMCTGLTSVTIPNSVTKIWDHAFSYCTSLTNITLPDSVTEIGFSAFSICSSLTNVTIGNNVTSIGSSAFWECRSLTSVTIPDSVTSIGSYAFHQCSSLTNVTIGNSVTKIGQLAFSRSGLKSITIPNSVTSIEDGAFSYCSNLTAFYGKFASLDHGCLIVKGRLIAFVIASSLTSYAIPNSVTSIGLTAFSGCNSLTSITIPNGVTSINSTAFLDCNSLTSIYCKAIAPPSVEGGADLKVNATLFVPTGSKAAYAAAKGWKNFTTIIETQF